MGTEVKSGHSEEHLEELRQQAYDHLRCNLTHPDERYLHFSDVVLAAYPATQLAAKKFLGILKKHKKEEPKKHLKILPGLKKRKKDEDEEDELKEKAKSLTLGRLKHMPKTGVVYVMSRAFAEGFYHGNPEWANLGQGAPECGELPQQPPRNKNVYLETAFQEYAPIGGLQTLREAIANYYNYFFRKGKDSQYTFENVAVTGGGRMALCRVMTCLDKNSIGYFLPDYTAYEQLLDIVQDTNKIPILHDKHGGFLLKPEILEKEIRGRGLGSLMISNPGNPTGSSVEGKNLEEYVRIARDDHVLMVMDEFYSHYLYTQKEGETGKMISAASYIEDVDQEQIILINGMTKNWRCPGWRVCWAVGPKIMIEQIASCGSFMDGGANTVLQNHSVPMLDPEFVKKDVHALQTHFRMKRDYVVSNLRKLGFIVDHVPQGTFYVWLNLEKLPAPLNDGTVFFELGLKYKFIVVPGIFFDINPGHKRMFFDKSPYKSFVRFSFGPSMEQLERGVAAITKLVQTYRIK